MSTENAIKVIGTPTLILFPVAAGVCVEHVGGLLRVIVQVCDAEPAEFVTVTTKVFAPV